VKKREREVFCTKLKDRRSYCGIAKHITARNEAKREKEDMFDV
jgi:hypothetical protein